MEKLILPVKSKDKTGPGRPKGPVRVEFVLERPVAEYLTAVGKRHGWGSSIQSISKFLVKNRYFELQTSLFHEKAMPAETPEDDDDGD